MVIYDCRKKMQYQGLCCCPRSKWWLCDMICMYCDYRCDGTLSLNMPQGDDEDVVLMDIIPDKNLAMEDVQADRDMLDSLIRRLFEIDPDAESILAMWKENDKISDRALAEVLGEKQPYICQPNEAGTNQAFEDTGRMICYSIQLLMEK